MRARTHTHTYAKCFFIHVHVVAACEDCSPGKYTSRQQQDVCAVCAAGKYSSAKASACGTCQQGTYSELGSSACTLCPVGTYNDQLQQSSCAKCAQNTYMDYLGKTACYDCPIQSATLGTGFVLSIYVHMYAQFRTLVLGTRPLAPCPSHLVPLTCEARRPLRSRAGSVVPAVRGRAGGVAFLRPRPAMAVETPDAPTRPRKTRLHRAAARTARCSQRRKPPRRPAGAGLPGAPPRNMKNRRPSKRC